MPAQVSQREVCVKHGLILTCFVNGRKRFKAVCLSNIGVERAVAPQGASHPGPSASPDIRRRLR